MCGVTPCIVKYWSSIPPVLYLKRLTSLCKEVATLATYLATPSPYYWSMPIIFGKCSIKDIAAIVLKSNSGFFKSFLTSSSTQLSLQLHFQQHVPANNANSTFYLEV